MKVAIDATERVAVDLNLEALQGSVTFPLGVNLKTPLQRVDDIRLQVRAAVSDSYDLRWWRLGRGSAVFVQAPAALGWKISEALHNAAGGTSERQTVPHSQRGSSRTTLRRYCVWGCNAARVGPCLKNQHEKNLDLIRV